ncbi:hypothetical protein B0H13DRAFT_1921721 [Mycena leptocephala]|nr:hypothetical protein B0H13DRAFT_1921721 [Mycena leptocephala]
MVDSRGPTYGEDVQYCLPGDSASFQPVIVGAVKHVLHQPTGNASVVLVAPPYSSNDMDVFFWNQVACLSSAASIRSRSVDPAVTFEDVIAWASGPSQDLNEIYIDVDSTALVFSLRSSHVEILV